MNFFRNIGYVNQFTSSLHCPSQRGARSCLVFFFMGVRQLVDDINREIEQLLGLPPYGVAPNEKLPILLTLLRREIEAAVRENPALANYVSHWPVSLSD